ncbi:MAG: DNA translocase FtsK 4TM domain-containing protein, partial [Gallionellaceae bacterium]|nr:DNA translocase FtsK 4TM domain-containing protein [Gallionellaceae bacterium]
MSQMQMSSSGATDNNKPSPLPGKLTALLRESRWLMLGVIAVYLILILYGYDRADPAWSASSGGNAVPHNPGGVFGAWLADVLLFTFGFSAWWWVVFLVQRVWVGYRGLAPDSLFDRRGFWLATAGFAVLLLSSCALEALRLYTLKVTLPEHGRMIGAIMGNGLSHLLGFTGATLFLLALAAVGFSLFTGLSWLRFIEWLGGFLETSFTRARNAWQTRQDRRIGAQALTQREAVVEEEKKRVEEHSPIIIQQPVLEVPPS